MYIVYKVLLVPQDAKSLFIVVHQPLHKQPWQATPREFLF